MSTYEELIKIKNELEKQLAEINEKLITMLPQMLTPVRKSIKLTNFNFDETSSSASTQSQSRRGEPTVKYIRQILDKHSISYKTTQTRDELWEVVKKKHLVRETRAHYRSRCQRLVPVPTD